MLVDLVARSVVLNSVIIIMPKSLKALKLLKSPPAKASFEKRKYSNEASGVLKCTALSTENEDAKERKILNRQKLLSCPAIRGAR